MEPNCGKGGLEKSRIEELGESTYVRTNNEFHIS